MKTNTLSETTNPPFLLFSRFFGLFLFLFIVVAKGQLLFFLRKQSKGSPHGNQAVQKALHVVEAEEEGRDLEGHLFHQKFKTRLGVFVHVVCFLWLADRLDGCPHIVQDSPFLVLFIAVRSILS